MWSKREVKKDIYKLFAYLGRYAHQQVWDMERRTTRELQEFAREVNQILKEESDQTKQATDID